jgi:protein arginine kinase activator
MFSEGLEPMLRGMHKGLKHTGKCPERLKRSLARDAALRELTASLRQAVVEEQYETAATLRDKIRAMEAEV